jgi:hypothetical protein
MTFTREPMSHWITISNTNQPYKSLPVTLAQTTIRPTNWPFSQRLYSRYELCDCNTFSEYGGVPQHHFYIEQILPETDVSKYPTNADHSTQSPSNLTSTDYIRSKSRMLHKHNTEYVSLPPTIFSVTESHTYYKPTQLSSTDTSSRHNRSAVTRSTILPMSRTGGTYYISTYCFCNQDMCTAYSQYVNWAWFILSFFSLLFTFYIRLS